MDVVCENIDGVGRNLRFHLAQALRRIQWSYAIFWAVSSRNPGVLEWVDGYYNGEIRTRKTLQAAEINADQMGLQRSEQLRELYESLLVGETIPQAKRHSALSPEDLTEAEWYYLVCMSFKFDIGQCLPGRALSKNQAIWLCNAHQVESKIFSRSLLAKSAGIETVVCFPYLGGAIELGSTKLVLEDINLIERVKALLLDIPCLKVPKATSYILDDANSPDSDHDKPERDVNLIIEGEEMLICSPDNSSNDSENHQEADSYIVEGIINEASQVYVMDEVTSNHIHNPVISTDSISLSCTSPPKISLLPNVENQECNQKETILTPRAEDIHYQSVLATLLSGSGLIVGPYLQNSKRKSSFISWKKEAIVPRNSTPQRLLKKVLCEVAKMHNGAFTEPSKDNGKTKSIWQTEMDKNHVESERKRREKINDRFMSLGSLMPINGKVDKLSILNETIGYVKELERRVQELESCKELEQKTRTPLDSVEGTSDNYGTSKRGVGKKRRLYKVKACDIDDDKVAVSVIGTDISIELRFPWREGVLLQIMEAMSNLRLDSDSVQSTNSNGILSVAIKSKLKGSKVSTVGEIKEEFWRVIKKC